MERPMEEEVFLIALEEFVIRHGGKPNIKLIHAVMGKLVMLTLKNVPPPSVLQAVPGHIAVTLDNLTNDNKGTRLVLFVQLALIRLMKEHGIDMTKLPEEDRIWIMRHAMRLPNLLQTVQSDDDPDLSKLRMAMDKVSERLESVPWTVQHPG